MLSIFIDYSQCGVRGKIRRSRMVGGLPSARGMWPWQVGLYRQMQRSGEYFSYVYATCPFARCVATSISSFSGAHHTISITVILILITMLIIIIIIIISYRITITIIRIISISITVITAYPTSPGSVSSKSSSLSMQQTSLVQ